MRTTAAGDPRAEARVAADLARIVAGIRALVPTPPLTSIALIGGFGRGEGGVLSDPGGGVKAFNDYDLMVTVTEAIDEAPLRRLSQELARTIDIDFVDIGVATPAQLAAAPNEVFWYELRAGHQVLFGDPAVLAAIPARDPATLPLLEATRLLVNRGLALLWARLELDEALASSGELPPAKRRFVVNATSKAVLAMGDAILIAAGRYDLSYPERARRLAECQVPFASDPDAAASFRGAHEAATRFKLYPEIPQDPVAGLLERWHTVRHWHERAFAWIESRRQNRPLNGWAQYPHRLALESLHEALAHPRVYWQQRCTVPDLRHWARWVLDSERSYRARLPFLLYGADSDDRNGALLRAGLRSVPNSAAGWSARWQAATRRLLAEWHP